MKHFNTFVAYIMLLTPCVFAVPPDMAYIPGGTFQMGDFFDEGDTDELPVHSVTLDSFYMGKYEITNQQYCDYLNSALGQGLITVTSNVVYQSGSGTSYPYCNTYQSSTYSQINWNGSVFSVRTKDGRSMTDDPMVMVSWYGSVAYCNWRNEQEGYEQCYNLSTWECDFNKNGYRLATEAEWEYAARGGLSGKRFPWGDTITHSQANYMSYWIQGHPYYPYDVSPTEGYHPSWNDGIFPYTSPVGSFSTNNFELYDMAGNIWEWCNDWYSNSYYYSSPANNPTGPISGSSRVVRGGGWINDAFCCRVAARNCYEPDRRQRRYGLRIVLGAANCSVPEIDLPGQPRSQNVYAGQSTSFTVDATGTEPLTYQWYKDEQVIPNSNSNTLTLNPVRMCDTGNYKVVVSNDCGSIASNQVGLTVQCLGHLKGINYTAWSWSAYSSPYSDQSLENAKLAGCTWVAINVFWFQDTITSTEIYPDPNAYSASTESVRDAIDRCHALGMKVMLKPMLDVKSGEWRARIIPSQAWFEEYQTFIDYWADEAENRDVEMLCIGCELIDTTSWSDSWRAVAANVRQHYRGDLVYAANHGNEQSIAWWDAVDYIGIDAYYPLTSKTDPSLAELESAWGSLADGIEDWLDDGGLNKPIIFTEVGYGSYDGSNITPWAGPALQPLDLQEQADCYQALLTSCKDRNWWSGVFWWNWATNPNEGGPTDKNMTPQGKPAQQVMSNYYVTTTGDLNDDQHVDINDLEINSRFWLSNTIVGWPDFNNDGVVNLLDYAMFVKHWLE